MLFNTALNLLASTSKAYSANNRVPFLQWRTLYFFYLIPLLLAETTRAQFSTPLVDATFDGAMQYPNSYTSGPTTWHMTWDDNTLFVFLQNANQSEPVTIYLDIDPIIPVNGGNDANGTLAGLDYDNYTTRPNLPFRADVAIYCHNGYRELFRRNGSNGWTSLGGGASGIRGDGTSDYSGGNTNGRYSSHDNGNGNGTDDRREFGIAWNRLLGPINGGNRPASFNWMGYVSYSNGMYAQVPVENFSGSGVASNPNGITRYFTVTSTANGTATNPFGRNSYTHPVGITNNSFGAIAVWDFTMNSPGQQIARLNSGGNWTIGNNLVVGSGIIYFGSGGTGYGTTTVAGSISLLGGTLNMDQTNKSLDVAGNLEMATGSNLALSGTLGGDIRIAGNWTRAASSVFDPNGRAVFFNGTTVQHLSITGGGTEIFNYLHIGGSGTLKLAPTTNAAINSVNGLTLASTNPTTTLDLNGQSLTITESGNLSLASGNRKVTSSLPGGIFKVAAGNLGIANPGTLEFGAATTMVLESGFDFGAGNATTINGTLQLDFGAFVNVNAPKYGPSSLLHYNSGSHYERRIEWNSNIGNTYGVPHNVAISNTTTLNYPFGTPGPLGMTGDLTIGPGSKLLMDYGGLDSNGPLTVMGNIVSAGEMTLGTLAGNDLRVGGNITFNPGYSFDAKNRAVFFTRNSTNGEQTITASSPLTFHKVILAPTSGTAAVKLETGTNLTIAAPLGVNQSIDFGTANNIFDINGNTLALGTSGLPNIILGANGNFKGSAASNLILRGTGGSIGTIRFLPSFRELRNLTIDREDATIAMNLGTPLTIVHSLTLNRGLVDLGSSTMSLNLGTVATGNTGSYVIADESGGSGRLRKRVGATDRIFEFPIGDRIDSENGPQYTPATVNFTGGDFATAYMTLSVNDSKHPEMLATTDYLSRYWRLTSTGITGDAAYSFSGKYHAAPDNYDSVGTEANSISGRWNGTQWTEGITIGIINNTLEISISTDATSMFTNDLSAGYPLGAPEINVKGNNLDIASGDTTPSAADFTDFGTSPATRSSTFLIQNLPTARRVLNITDTAISGDNASDFSITTAPSPSVSVGGTTYLVVRFTPSGIGTRTAMVTITSDDPDEGTYIFGIQGQGIDYTECTFGAEETIAIQDFEDSPATPAWGIATTLPAGATIKDGTGFGKIGDNGTSQTSDLFIDGKSLQVNNSTAEIIFDAINTSECSDVNLSLKVAAFSSTSGTSGLDNPDYIMIQISKDDGTTWTGELSINGNNNAKWSFTSGTGIGATVYDGNGTVENMLRPLGGGYRTTDGYSTLQITNLPLVEALRIKLTVLNNDPNEIWAIDNIELKGKKKSIKRWDGAAWSGDGSPPLPSELAYIEGNYDSQLAGSGFEGCECVIAPGVETRIDAGHYLEIQSHLTNNGSIILEDSAGLLQHDNLAINTGNAFTIKRNTSPVYRYDFTYWSSPLFANDDASDDATEGAFTLKQLSPMTLFDKYFKWGHAATEPAWQSIAAGAELMVPGRGYIVRAPQDFDIEGQSGAAPEIYTASFIGMPNNGTIQHEVTGSGSADKWNLLGNPYPSAIDIEKFLLYNNATLEGTIYLWTHNSQIQETGVTGIYNYNPSDYAAFNFSGATATAAATTGGNIPDKFLASGQGFFVKGINPSASNATFNNSMRIAGQNDQFFRSSPHGAASNSQAIEKSRIWLNLSGQNAFNQTLVGYIQNATNGLDWGYDGDHFGGNKVSLYSISQGKNLAIQGRSLPFNNQDQVQLGYKSTLAGTLKISIEHYDGLFESQDIYLEDLLFNTIHNLKNADYTFTTVQGTFDNRFVLRYMPQETLESSTFENLMDGVIISKDRNELKVRSSFENISKITIYDILGRSIFSEDAINSKHFTATDIVYSKQTLIVKLQLANNTIVTRKVIY